MGRIKDITGFRYGRLVVKSIAYKNKNGAYYWLCRCDCGIEKVINGASLRNGTTQSCGCLYRETIKSPRRGKINKRKIKKGRYKSSVDKKRLVKVRSGMYGRCYNKNNSEYHNYGGRGITICDEWLQNSSSFYTWAFDSGYKKGLTIERIDNEGNYCPENCTWITRKEQNNNKRNNHILIFNGVEKTLTQWSEDIGVSYNTLMGRRKRGWSVEDTLTLPKYASPKKRH